jgi:glutamyl-tRNA(Gln) amidotransferase subunit D
MSGGLVDHFVDQGYRGIVIAGTGLGHTPDNLDQSLKRAIDAGLIVAMTSQCIWGRVDMNVYRTGVKLLEMGVVSCEDMLAETALAKLMWLLANLKDTEKVRENLTRNIVGEIEMRTELSEYKPLQEAN